MEIAIDEIKQQEYPNWKSILTLILHDTLETHPSRFRDIFDIVPLDVFCRIVKLSKLSDKYRIEIQHFLFDHISTLPLTEISRYDYIFQML